MDSVPAGCNPEIFRAYDIRGVVDRSLTAACAYRIGRAFAAEAEAGGIREVVVAADGRLSSPRFKTQLIRGLTDSGCRVIDIGLVPTPVLYFAAQQQADETGIMITGSHNPPNYNGFKLVLGGEALSGSRIQALAQRIKDEAYVNGTGQVISVDRVPAYLQRILDDVRLQRGMKVVVDCGNGIAGQLAPRLLERLGCDVIPLYCEVDGHFPNHHPDPSKPANLQDAIRAVRAHRAELGLVFDGDGDRVGLISPAGQAIFADRVLMLLAEDMLARNPGAEVLFDVKCSRRLPQVIEQAGGKARMWKTGHSLMKRKMKATGALLAGEVSGHFFFKERWYGFDDGLYAAARLLEILSGRTDDADALFAAYPEDISTPEINIEVSETTKFALIEALQQVEFPGGTVSHIDGVRVDYADGWGLVRASNTTPVLVLRFEAENRAALNRIQSEFQARLSALDDTLVIPVA